MGLKLVSVLKCRINIIVHILVIAREGVTVGKSIRGFLAAFEILGELEEVDGKFRVKHKAS